MLLFVAWPAVALDKFTQQTPLHKNELSTVGVIELLGTLKLPKTLSDKTPLFGLSALAWDNNKQELYALSDKSHVFIFKLVFSQKSRLESITLLRHFWLKDKKGQRLRKSWKDSEGLTLLKTDFSNVNLVVSFERKHRVWVFDDQGYYIKAIKLPKKFTKNKYYAGRNNGLEAITSHPDLGLVVVKERSAKSRKRTELYVEKWNKVLPLALEDLPKSRVTAIEAMPNGHFLVLERSFTKIWQPLVINLKEIQISQKETKVLRNIATLETHRGWLLDNFEGLTFIKNNTYCMVSDNNKSLWQQTLLSCFKIKE